MKLFLAEYAQRLLLSVFMVAFGLYLLVATLTYTPFDPGWTHLSSDTQSVTNASGVAGAWIADLLYGFLGRAALLVPLVLLLEVVQLWWPHSFVTRPFRLAAQLFLIVAVAALCSLHVYEPADTLSNASGGIIGYELAGRLLGLVNIWLVTGFLVGLLLLMMTLAFGIQWSRTLDTLGRLPPAIAALFARQPADESAPIQQVLPQHSVDHALEQPAVSTAADPVQLSHAPQSTSLEQPAEQSHEWALEQPLEQSSEPTKPAAIVPTVPAEFGQAALPSVLPDSTAQRISPAFNWQDQDVFQELLQAVPTHPVAAASVSPDPFDLAFSSIDAALNQPVVADVPLAAAVAVPVVAAVAPVQAKPVQAVDLAQPDQPDHIEPIEPVLNEQPVSVPFMHADDQSDTLPDTSPEPLPESLPTVIAASAVPELTELAWQEQAWAEQPEQDEFAPASTHDDLDLDDEIAAKPLADEPTASTEPHTIKITTLDPKELEDFDAPLTDASGRVMSRSMQVAAHRATLSPLPSLDLLDLPDPDRKPSYTPEELSRLSELLEIKLLEFNIKGQVIEAQPGPVVTRFEVELAAGVKASKVTNISKDLARSMSMGSVRVLSLIHI